MAAALTLLLTACLLQSALCREFKTIMPQTIEALRGSCVTIPCSFDIEEKFDSNLNKTCKAKWMIDDKNIVFDSSEETTIKGELRGDLLKKDCTTTLNNIVPHNKNTYYFRLECAEKLKYSYKESAKIEILVEDNPPRPTLTPSTLTVKEGTSVSLKCSAPAPCLSHPPALTWTPGLGDSQETLQENQDKTTVKTSVVNFTASESHHGKTISCNAAYSRQDGSTKSSVSSLTADISYSPQSPRVSVSPSGPVPENRDVTLTCSSTANPAVKNYTWYRTDGGQETFIGSGHVLKIKASKDSSPVFCKAENDLGSGRSNISQIDVQYSPQHTRVSVSPSGPVPENRDVTLTCSSTANPAVKNYTWYRADGGQETFIGSGHVLNIKASEVSGPVFCKVENDLGSGRSNISQIDVQFAPQILPSSVCTKAAAQLNCSCETVANPSPTFHWYLDGLPVNHSDKFAISNEPLNDTGLRSIITVNRPQWGGLSTLLCRSSNSLGSTTQRFYVYSLDHQTSADQVTLPVFIITVVSLLVLVCALLFVIRAQNIHHNLPKSQCTGDTSTVAMSELLTTGEGHEVPNATEDHIYANSATTSEPNSTTWPVSGPNHAEGDSKSSKKTNEGGSDVIYSSVNFKSKRKKKKDDSVDMYQPDSSYLEEERCMVGGMCRQFVSNAVEMGNLYDEMEPRSAKKEGDCVYAQVRFKEKSTVHK